MEYDRPTRQEIASVIALAARLYLGGAATPRRYYAWGQAVRWAVLAVVLVHAAQGLSLLTLLAWRRHLAAWFPALPASLAGPVPDGPWPTVINVVDCVWIRGLLIPAEELLGPGDARAAHLPDHDHPARCRCSRGDSGRHDGL
jgi:hypothetical protein